MLLSYDRIVIPDHHCCPLKTHFRHGAAVCRYETRHCTRGGRVSVVFHSYNHRKEAAWIRICPAERRWRALPTAQSPVSLILSSSTNNDAPSFAWDSGPPQCSQNLLRKNISEANWFSLSDLLHRVYWWNESLKHSSTKFTHKHTLSQTFPQVNSKSAISAWTALWWNVLVTTKHVPWEVLLKLVLKDKISQENISWKAASFLLPSSPGDLYNEEEGWVKGTWGLIGSWVLFCLSSTEELFTWYQK